MNDVILGLPGSWADDNYEVADHYTTKFGGVPDWPFSNSTIKLELLECRACKSSLCLLAQIYAPISTKSLTSEERTLYVFGCVMNKCGTDSSSWKAIRVQKSFSSDEPNLHQDEVAPLPSSSISAPKAWQEDLWTFESREDDDIDLEELGRALSEAATISSNTKKQNCELLTALKHSPVALKTRFVDKTPVLPCFYIYTQQEIILKEVSSGCSKSSSVSITGNRTDLASRTSEEKWEEESYEYDRALTADRTYLKFKKRMDAYPEQCIRYSYAGEPLLATFEERGCGRCNLCGAPRHYEMQLMPPLLYFLQEATGGQEKISLENWNWMTLIVYTCSKSCVQSADRGNSGNQGWTVTEEAVVVQNE